MRDHLRFPRDLKVLAATALVFMIGSSAAQAQRAGHAVIATEADLASVSRSVTQAKVEQAVASSDSLRLWRVRQAYSSGIRRVPSLPADMRYGAGRDLRNVQEGIARMKSAARRYFDGEAYRAVARGLTEDQLDYIRKEMQRYRDPVVVYGRLAYADSLSVPSARFLDVRAASVGSFLYRRAAAHYGFREDGEAVAAEESATTPARSWRLGEPVVMFPTGSLGNDPNPLHTLFSVPVYEGNRVQGVIAFNAYSGHIMYETAFDDALSRFPFMSLDEAEARVEAETGEAASRSVFLNAYVDFLLPVPAVLMEDGSVYLVDPLVEAIW